MHAENKLGHEVYAIYPGNRFPFAKKMSVRQMSPFKGITCYKIKNALPLPLLHGIHNTAYFQMPETDGYEQFDCFFQENRIDVLHVHTMMGMPVSLLLAAKKMT
jgi:hypothetical protein